MADEMKSELNAQIKMMIALMHDVSDMWANQVSESTKDELNLNYPKSLPSFEDLILDIQNWRVSSFNPARYTFVCSCDNELSSVSPELDEIRGVVACHNCGQTDYWLPESEVDADEVLIQDIK